MNIFSIAEKFNTHAKCIKHLEKVRWNNKPVCPHCGHDSITKRGNRKTTNYHCNFCNKDFTVLVGTIFEGSKMPLPKWFMLIALMLNARKGVSSKQISRDLGITYKSAWYSAMRVRCAMMDDADMLEGIVEMDEVYLGGRPRKRNKGGKPSEDNTARLSSVRWDDSKKNKRGRGADKVKVVGIVEREGKKRVVTQMKDRLTGKEMLAMLKRYVKTDSAVMMTDEFTSYNVFDDYMQHLTVNHAKGEYVKDGVIHTNTIEGFWSIIKNGIRGQYHVLSKKYLPFYLAEFAYKYNRRNEKTKAFGETISNAVTDDKCAVNYKPKGEVKDIAYPPKEWENNPLPKLPTEQRQPKRTRRKKSVSKAKAKSKGKALKPVKSKGKAVKIKGKKVKAKKVLSKKLRKPMKAKKVAKISSKRKSGRKK